MRRTDNDVAVVICGVPRKEASDSTYADRNTPEGEAYVYRGKALNSSGAGDRLNFVRAARS